MRTHAFFLLIMVIFMFMMRMKNYILFKESERMTLTFILLLILARKMIGGFLQQKEVTGFIYLPGR